jgi:hypothetical protein
LRKEENEKEGERENIHAHLALLSRVLLRVTRKSFCQYTLGALAVTELNILTRTRNRVTSRAILPEKGVLRIRIRIRRIRMFFSLPDPDPLVSGTDQDPSVIKQK